MSLGSHVCTVVPTKQVFNPISDSFSELGFITFYLQSLAVQIDLNVLYGSAKATLNHDNVATNSYFP